MSDFSIFLGMPRSAARIALAVAVVLPASDHLRADDGAPRPNSGVYVVPTAQPPSLAPAAPLVDPQVRPANSLSTPQVLSDYTRAAAVSQPPSAAHPTPPHGPPPGPFPSLNGPGGEFRPASRPKTDSLPLPARGAVPKAGTASATAPLLTTGASLAAVLLLFFGVAWVMRRGMPTAQTLLPSEVVETLGRAPLPGRQQMQLIRCGNKLLLVCISAAGAETLTEITDPVEIERLSGLCREAHPHSATTAFRQVLEQFGRQRAAPGFAGDSAAEAMQLTGRLPQRRFGRQEDDDV